MKLFELRGSLSKAEQGGKREIYDLLRSIAQNIKAASDEFGTGKYPHGFCQVLLSHAEQMVPAIGNLVGAEKASELAHQLHDVWQIENLRPNQSKRSYRSYANSRAAGT